MKNDVSISVALVDDAKNILDIYAPYVSDTAISFEYDVPSLDDFKNRMKNTLEKYPFIIAKIGNEIVGYAYTGAFKGRAAYDWSVETTIYVKQGKTKLGIGKKLYNALENISKLQNIKNLNACIGYPKNDDEHLTKNSAQFHKHLGFKIVGEFHNCGYKFNKWYNMIWAEKIIGEHDTFPQPFVKFSDLCDNDLHFIGIDR